MKDANVRKWRGPVGLKAEQFQASRAIIRMMTDDCG